MPHDSSIPIHEKPADVLRGEVPQTTFVDYFDAIQVSLIHWPDHKTDLVGHAFQRATWGTEPYLPGNDQSQDHELEQNLKILAFEGKGLPLSLELYDFVFCVHGISRIVTHQIVRNRIGATYSQQASGDKDWRHHRALVPRSIFHEKKLWPKFRDEVLRAKMLYAEMLDSMEIPILDARRVLPHCLETYIYVKFNLVTLISFIRKRDCVQTQEPEMVIVARRMREAVLSRFPHLKEMLQNQCKSGRCFYSISDRQVGTSMFVPDHEHDFVYNENNFIYQKSVHDMIYELTPVVEEQYVGLEKVRR
jgi:thymidylate synthase ThyX